MDLDLLTLPPTILMGLVLWTLILLTYRIFQAVIEEKKPLRPQVGLPFNEGAPTGCVHTTSEYFLKSSEPCTCTGVISGVVTHISDSDKFRLFHSDPGYSQFEDTLHVRLTGLKISQHGIKSLETVVDVGHCSSSAKTTNSVDPGEKPFNYDRGHFVLSDENHGNSQHGSYLDERQPGFDTFTINKTHSSDDFRIEIPNHTDANQRVLVKGPPSYSSQPVITIPEVKLPVLTGKEFIIPTTYGQLNKSHHKRAWFASVNPDHQYPLLENILGERVDSNDNFLKNVPLHAEDIQNPFRGAPGPEITPPDVQPSIPDTNVIVASDANEYPIFDITLHKGIGDNPSFKDYLTNVSRQRAAYWSTEDLRGVSNTIVHPNTTPIVKQPTDSTNCTHTIVHAPCTENNVKSPHFDILQKIRIPSTEDNPMEIYDQKTAEQLPDFLQGSVIPTVNLKDDMTKWIVPNSNGLALPEARPRNIQFGNDIHCSMPQIEIPQKNQPPSPQWLQIDIPEDNNINGLSEPTMNPKANLDYPHDTRFEVLSNGFEYSQTDITSSQKPTGNNILLIPDNQQITGQHTVDSCASPRTITADGCDFVSVYESHDCGPSMKLQMGSHEQQIVDRGGEPSSRKSIADDPYFTDEEASEVRYPEKLINFTPDRKEIDRYTEALRSIILSRRKSSSSSSCSISSTSEDDSLIFSSSFPERDRYGGTVEVLPRTKAICSCTGMISGTVTHITDGDTIKLQHKCLGLSELIEMRIRLAGIDAPELPDQPFSEESKEQLKNLIYEKMVDLETFGLDQYDRVLGMVYLPPSENVNLEMVRCGYACVYTGRGAVYGKFKEDFKRLEEEAKTLKKGMWSQKDIVLPGEYKKQRSRK